jgi:hypothetical protein
MVHRRFAAMDGRGHHNFCGLSKLGLII